MAGDPSDEIVLCVLSTRYASDHPAWRDQVTVLRKRLHEVERHDAYADGGEVAMVPVPLRLSDEPDSAGGATKGVLELSALMLGSASMIRAAAVVIREWRRQDASRSVSIKLVRGDESLEIDGKGAGGADAAYQALRAALENDDGRPASADGSVSAG